MPERQTENRHLIRWVGLGIAGLVAVGGAAFYYFGGKFFNRDFTMTVCQGETRQICGAEHWISCETDPVAFMKRVRADVCINVTAKKVSEVPGNKCSSTTFEMKCSR